MAGLLWLLQWKNQVVVTENVWPIESKIFTTYPLQKKRNETNNNNKKKQLPTSDLEG